MRKLILFAVLATGGAQAGPWFDRAQADDVSLD